MSHSESHESQKSHCLSLLSKYLRRKKERRRRKKKNWPLLDLSASPQVKMKNMDNCELIFNLQVVKNYLLVCQDKPLGKPSGGCTPSGFPIG